MSTAQDKLIAKVERLRRQSAIAEALIGDVREKLAKAEAQLAGQAAPTCGLDLLWQAALPKSRERSTRHKCRVAWNRIPKQERPTVQKAVAALKIWNRCEDWKRSDHMYAPGLHRFISERMWEDLPESARPVIRPRPAPLPPLPTIKPEDLMSKEQLAAFFSLKNTQEVPE